ncbi:MAG: hypothetical protein OEV42_21545, partial [Deltaproteobacteria bacterium]|nr:hypothetical protein [Deltaproteobacteria bacterium]
KKRRPIHGALPYRHLNLPALLPVSNINVTPAYRGGSVGSLPEDLAASEEAPISKEMTDLAESLNWNPVEIYEYVKNNVHSEWYYGCMKGAEETARQKSGNDCDQAALLVALLRASGFPSRYVTGTIEFFGGMEQAKNLTGIDEPMNIARFLQKAGIPYEPVIAGGKMVNYRFSHVWVDSYIPYSNYRGAVIDGHGKTWLGLDTFIKAAGYEVNAVRSLTEDFTSAGYELTALRDEYLSAVQGETPLEYLRSKMASLGLQSFDYLKKRAQRPEILNIIPAGLQFKAIAVTGESAKLPAELKQKVRFSAKVGIGENILDITLDTIKVAGKGIALTYEPETIDDQEIINAWGGLDNTPAYLVRLRPVLTIDGERIAVATGGLAMGSDYEVTVELRGAGSNIVEKITNTHIAGNLSVIGIGTRSITKVHKEKSAEILLFEEAKNYTNRWSEAEEELASLLNLAIARPLPSVVTLGGAIDVAYLFDTPHGFEWTGVFMDADFRAIEVIPSLPPLEKGGAGGISNEKQFMRLAALEGSILENRIFEEDFQVDSISTAKLFQHATEVITVNSTNIDTTLPTLLYDDYIKEEITNAVNQQFEIRIPHSEISYMDWLGTGWLKENIQTGESGWMLTGMIAGGMTAVNKQDWIEQDIKNYLSLPFSPGINPDPRSVRRLVRLNRALGDYQKKEAGELLDTSFDVMALDAKGKGVKGVPVTFVVIEGVGTIIAEDDKGNPLGASASILTVTTGPDGIARVRMTTGAHVSDSPFYLYDYDTRVGSMVGLNVVDVLTATDLAGLIKTD